MAKKKKKSSISEEDTALITEAVMNAIEKRNAYPDWAYSKTGGPGAEPRRELNRAYLAEVRAGREWPLRSEAHGPLIEAGTGRQMDRGELMAGPYGMDELPPRSREAARYESIAKEIDAALIEKRAVPGRRNELSKEEFVELLSPDAQKVWKRSGEARPRGRDSVIAFNELLKGPGGIDKSKDMYEESADLYPELRVDRPAEYGELLDPENPWLGRALLKPARGPMPMPRSVWEELPRGYSPESVKSGLGVPYPRQQELAGIEAPPAESILAHEAARLAKEQERFEYELPKKKQTKKK